MNLHILVVNINNLGYTKALVEDLKRQTYTFRLTLVDQGSTEEGTAEYLKSLREYRHFEVFTNGYNVDLNRLWNDLYMMSHSQYLCFLNNDVRVPRNFVMNTIKALDDHQEAGVVIYPTNRPDYRSTKPYCCEVLEERIAQGWCFTMRRKAYTPIPNDLKVFGGDDWLFVQMYRKGYKAAMLTCAPIIHFRAKSHRYFKGNRQEDADALKRLGIERLPYRSQFTKMDPTFQEIIEGDGCRERGKNHERARV